MSKPGSDPSLPLSIKGPPLCDGPLGAVVSASCGLLEAGGAEDASDDEFCVMSSERVPVGKSSANKSEGDLPKLPERRIGAPNGECRRKNADPRSGSSFGRHLLRFSFAGCSVANRSFHNFYAKKFMRTVINVWLWQQLQ
jgi:hypothetical protein